MSRRQKTKGRRESGGFVRIPHAVIDSQGWKLSNGTAIKMLCELARCFNGFNNGDLAATFKMLRPRGWSSPETITNACRELRSHGLIELTRQGGLHRSNLYALTWYPIDECRGKLDVASTKVASGLWKAAIAERYKRPPKNRKPTTPVVLQLIRHA